MKVKLVTLALVILTLCFTTACKPTPEISAVVRRDNIENIILETLDQNNIAPYHYNAPDNWEEVLILKGQKKEVTIDANIVIPNMNEFPVAQVVPTTFTQEMADKIRKFFIGDQILIESKQGLTKSDYDEMIIKEQAGHYDGEYHYVEQDVIEQLIADREKAPELIEQKVITDFSIEDIGYSGVINDNECCSISANETMIWYADNDGYFCSIWDYDFATNTYLKDMNIEMKLTEQEAIAIANQNLESLGIEGVDVVQTEPVYLYDEDNRDLSKPNSTGYSLHYMRGIQELLPVYMFGGGMSPNQQFDYTPPMNREDLWLLIDDTGAIKVFRWSDPMYITDVLLENIEIMPFDQVKKRLIDQLTYEKAFVDDEAYCFDIIVNEVRLAVDTVPVKDNDTACLYVPCWYLSYQEIVKEGRGDHQYYTEGRPNSFIIINAIDGGSIATITRKTIKIINEG